MVNIFIFHRDFRLYDNSSLISQIKKTSEGVIPIFIFDPVQIDKKKNKYFSNNSVQFMIESLKDLQKQIKKYDGELYFFYGKTIDVLKEIHTKININSIAFNFDYTPFAKKRTNTIEKWCKINKIELIIEEDYPLYNILDGQTLKKNNTPYLVYSPFLKFTQTLKVSKPNNFSKFKFTINKKLQDLRYFYNDLDRFYNFNVNLNVNGGRDKCVNILKNMKKFKNYKKNRDNLTYETTFLSAYIHFNVCSIREIYYEIIQQLGKDSALLRELVFRDFYINIIHYFPHTLEGQITKKENKSFKSEYDAIEWNTTKVLLEKWKKGLTGFPVVDAGMRQMNSTGFMHNRCRMITSNFLVKDLQIDWRLGEKYFAQTLQDYDPINNSSGWQWSTGNGTDAQPYFRIFNPWTQQKNHDKDCEYIKTWIPELKNVSPNDIHNWFDDSIRNKYSNIKYPAPIVDHSNEREKILNLYKKYLK